MRLFLTTFLVFYLLLTKNSWGATEGPATVYKITMTQIE